MSIGFAVMLAVVLIGSATAGAGGYEWRDHATPFGFVFGNHIDTHQQSKQTGGSGLVGFLYITPSDQTTTDGVPIAKHGDCAANPDGCEVGWMIHGRALVAEYCGHVEGEHPAWAILPEDMPVQRGFSHFHWLNETTHHDGLTPGSSYPGYVLKLTAVNTFVFDHHNEFLVTPGIDLETHANLYATCEEWPHFGAGHGDHSG